MGTHAGKSYIHRKDLDLRWRPSRPAVDRNHVKVVLGVSRNSTMLLDQHENVHSGEHAPLES